MIFPFLDGLARFSQARVTWLLVAINAAVMIATHGLATRSQNDLEAVLRDDYFRDSQGRIYSQFIQSHKSEYSTLMQQISDKALEGNSEKVALLGTMAIRDDRFLSEAPSLDFLGDQIAVQNWRETLVKVQEIQSYHPSYILGLSSADMGAQKWLSYIFIHSGAVHFFGNMIFLILFGCALEPLIGSLAFLLVFLSSGILAAGAFVLLTGSTAAPLIGASGAVSGVMALFACLYWHQAVRFVYWLYLPFRGFAGYVYLPAWVVLLMWIASDLAGFLGTLTEFGGVAYAAHLGGETTGVLVGLMFYFFRFRTQAKLTHSAHPIGKIIPFDQVRPSAVKTLKPIA